MKAEFYDPSAEFARRCPSCAADDPVVPAGLPLPDPAAHPDMQTCWATVCLECGYVEFVLFVESRGHDLDAVAQVDAFAELVTDENRRQAFMVRH